MDSVEFPLERTERKLWSGAPEAAGLTFKWRELAVAVFGAAFLAILWMAGAETVGGAKRPLNEFFAILLGAGAAAALVAPLHRRRMMRRTNYCITDERVMLVRGSKLETVYLVELRSVLLQENGDGSGTIRLGDDLAHSTRGDDDRGKDPLLRSRYYAVELAPRIADVANVRKVYRILEDARTAAHKGGGLK